MLAPTQRTDASAGLRTMGKEGGGGPVMSILPGQSRPISRWSDSQSWRELRSEIADLSSRLGHSPNATDLADHLAVPRDEVIDCMTQFGALDRGPHIADTAALDLHVLEDGLVTLLQNQRIRPLLLALPEDERAVLLLRLAGSLTHTEIAAQIGISAPTVSRMLLRALAFLRDRL